MSDKRDVVYNKLSELEKDIERGQEIKEIILDILKDTLRTETKQYAYYLLSKIYLNERPVNITDLVNSYNNLIDSNYTLITADICICLTDLFLAEDDNEKALKYLVVGLDITSTNNYIERHICLSNDLGKLYFAAELYEEASVHDIELLQLMHDKSHKLIPTIYFRIIYAFYKLKEMEKVHYYISLINQNDYKLDLESELMLLYIQGVDALSDMELEKALDIFQHFNKDDSEMLYKYAQFEMINTNIELNNYEGALLIANKLLENYNESNTNENLNELYILLIKVHHTLKNYELSSDYMTRYYEIIETSELERVNKKALLLSCKAQLKVVRKELADSKEANHLLNKKSKELHLISEIGSLFIQQLDFQTLIKKIYTYLNTYINSEMLAIATIKDNYLEYSSIIDKDNTFPSYKVAMSEKDSLGVQAIEKNELIYIKDFLNVQTRKIQITETKDETSVRSLVFLPLYVEMKPIGVLTIQNRDVNSFDDNAINFLKDIASYISIAIVNAMEAKAIEEATITLKDTIDSLRETEVQLVQVEKLASLGRLVTAVAKEIELSIIRSYTMAEKSVQEVGKINQRLKEGTLKQSELEFFFENAKKITKDRKAYLNHASKIVNSFKQLTIHPSMLKKKNINFRDFMQKIISINKYKHENMDLDINLSFDEDFSLHSYPDVIKDVFDRIISNSVEHSFINESKGRISIDIHRSLDYVIIRYTDNGMLIQGEIRDIFSPFYSSRKSEGFIGLGLFIVKNLLTQVLNGSIDYNNSDNCNTYTIKLGV